MTLAIISHTPHYIKDGKVTGWGPTVREINHLTEIFEKIYHLAPLHDESPPESSMQYLSDRIKFIPLKPYGGEKLKEKFSIITTAPENLKKIKEVADRVDWIQFRAPTAMGLYVLPYLSLARKPKLWVKYAGNWMHPNPPLSYRIQRWWLKNNYQKSKVTINGHWQGQEKHIIDFQNPCLDNDELRRAKEIANKKDFSGKLILLFVGTLTKNKGVDLILEALNNIKDKNNIEEMIFAGDSPLKRKYEKLSEETGVRTRFTGFLNRQQLERLYAVSHLLLLPSESEGFPKVVAEAAAYGCVPIVSDVSSISQYFHGSNAFLLKNITSEELEEKLEFAFSDRQRLKIFSERCVKISELFTFEKYNENLKEKILSD